MTEVLALDVASTTGWARGRVGDERPQCGSVRFGKANASPTARIGHATSWAITLTKTWLPDMVAIEGLLPPAALKRRSNEEHELLGRLQGAIMGVLWNRGCYKINLHPLNSIRAHFLYGIPYGKGEAKEMVLRKCRSLGWLEEADDDAADACALWSYQCSLLDHDEMLRISPLFGKLSEVQQ